MPPRAKILIAVFSLLAAPVLLVAQDKLLASTPPMGWNSWNKFGCKSAKTWSGKWPTPWSSPV